MKLYRISQDINDGYDTYDSAIVAAESEYKARVTSPSSFYRWDEENESWAFQFSNGTEQLEYSHSTWSNPDKVTVEYIGEATIGIKPGVILASFNAG